MCGIFCSFSKDMIKVLAELNSSRGSHSFSVCDSHGDTFRSLGKFDINKVADHGYHVCHVQAPTTEARSIDSVHPASLVHHLLWHNGIIKDFEVKRLQEKHNTVEPWDTKLLLQECINGSQNLSDINGSFACILFDGEDFFAFRNEISPLFHDSSLNISSVKFDGAVDLPPNQIFRLNLLSKKLDATGVLFSTKENPYFFAD